MDKDINSLKNTDKNQLYELDFFPEKLIKHCQKCLIIQKKNQSPQQQQSKKIYENENCQKNQENIDQLQKEVFLWKPPRSYHCKICQQCVFLMDHHCVWVNNCIGANNIKFFFLFNFYTCLYSLASGIWIMSSIYVYYVKQPKTSFDDFGKYIMGFYGFLSMFFVFFTFVFISDLLTSIENNQTTVEEEKKIKGKPCRKLFQYLKQTFGDNYLLWYIPVHQKINRNYLELTYPETKKFEEQFVYFEDKLKDDKHIFYQFYQNYKYI
ncbi:hypothetical protein PPERSA_12740 [Pseudocohnilembus persalinus]|uniref:Palmitoyltransferase n=1 Tax=Pseudocohnilembus persalinus TaxID=266149 RepID=A0A0V0QU89_PSEPJ|nr:hypothetical protein PPERSA_12740 [Pseudocohnilembus persalinus]|eukprot:KRX05562.1 hypothetical protein PPERSA_12740 [Pseudocohnilembus persalinus]